MKIKQKQQMICKVLFAVCICLLIGAFSIMPCTGNALNVAYADSISVDKKFVSEVAANKKTESNISVDGKSAYICDNATGTVVFSKNENARLPIASMVKIMTSLLVFEAIEDGKIAFSEMVAISENSASMGGSQVFLDAGTEHSVENLLKTIVVASANDSCVALAERIAGSVGAFVANMNERAKSLGMENTNFVNCTGLPASEGFSSAKDVSVMFRELIKHERYFDFSKIWLEDYPHPGGRTTTITNTNKLVRFYKGCDGGKTGFTTEAKFCLSATAKRGDMRLVAVVVGADSSQGRFDAIKNMFEHTFSGYTNKTLIAKGDNVENSIEIVGGKKSNIILTVDRDLTQFMSRKESAAFEIKFELPNRIKAKINASDIVGKAYLTKDGVVVDEVNVVANEDIAKSTIFDEIKKIGEKWCKYKK